MRNSLLFATATLVAVSGPVLATNLSDFDGNSDGYISFDEFFGAATDFGVYYDYDRDGDGLIEKSELTQLGFGAVYDEWDTNDDGYIGSAEFYNGYYDYYDSDEDGHWDGDEWDDANEDGIFDF